MIYTKRKYTIRDLIRVIRWQLSRQLMLLFGRFAGYLESCHWFWKRMNERAAAKQAGPLSEEQIQELINDQQKVGRLSKKRWAAQFPPEEINKPVDKLRMQARAAKLVDNVIRNHSGIRAVANIGARIDLASCALAQIHSDITFISVDFQSNLEEHNAGLTQSSNWRFMSGYALNLIRNGQLKTDIIFFNGTAFLLNSKELDAYMEAFAKSNVRFVIFNEVIYPNIKSFRYGITLPEEIPENNPYISGKNGHYMHNYPAKLQWYGYEVISSELLGNPVFEPSNFNSNGGLNLQVVGKLEAGE